MAETGAFLLFIYRAPRTPTGASLFTPVNRDPGIKPRACYTVEGAAWRERAGTWAVGGGSNTWAMRTRRFFFFLLSVAKATAPALSLF